MDGMRSLSRPKRREIPSEVQRLKPEKSLIRSPKPDIQNLILDSRNPELATCNLFNRREHREAQRITEKNIQSQSPLINRQQAVDKIQTINKQITCNPELAACGLVLNTQYLQLDTRNSKLKT